MHRFMEQGSFGRAYGFRCRTPHLFKISSFKAAKTGYEVCAKYFSRNVVPMECGVAHSLSGLPFILALP